MPKQSAGVLLYRVRNGSLEVFLVHPGGPFWAKKDTGAWSIPKGELADGEERFDAAVREFREETGFEVRGEPTPLTPVRQQGGKTIHAWAFEGDCDSSALRSNSFSMEWPARSGLYHDFPEVDRGAWFSLEEATRKINPAQASLLAELSRLRGPSQVFRKPLPS
jgi:predicted NUDIX family NTP pyrophosphohydrolase